MTIKIREQAGTDATRKFDYQMAVALDYLLDEIDGNAIVLIETLEDFAVFHNYGTELEKVDIFQVKTKNSGLYTKTLLLEDDVLGKIILSDFYFDSKANTLNIVCNTNLKGTSTEELDSFSFQEKLTDSELKKIKANIASYMSCEPKFKTDIAPYIGKLIYIKSALPFSGSEDRYNDTLIGKTNAVIAKHLGDDQHSINPKIVFDTLKLLIDRQRRVRIATAEIEVEEALKQKGISTDVVKTIIDQAAENCQLTKKEILQYAIKIFSPSEYLRIKDDYAQYLSCRANLTDLAFQEAKEIIENEYRKESLVIDSLDEIVRNVANKCMEKLPYYSLAIIQIMTIAIVYS